MPHPLTWSTTQLRRLKEPQATPQQKKLTFEAESSRNRSFQALADALARKERDRLLEIQREFNFRVRSHFLIFTTMFSFNILPVYHTNNELTHPAPCST